MAAWNSDNAPGVRPVAGTRAGADEAVLVARLAAGDREAFGVLVARHLSAVASISRRMLRDDAEAEDVAQETMLRLWRSADRIDVGGNGVRGWLCRVASNLCIDRIRAARRETVVDEVPETPDPARQLEGLERGDTAARVDVALKSLPERQRQALVLFHYEGMSQIEVGAAMGISDEAVESLLARARRALKVALADEWKNLLAGD